MGDEPRRLREPEFASPYPERCGTGDPLIRPPEWTSSRFIWAWSLDGSARQPRFGPRVAEAGRAISQTSP
jgi:hypothetical protein